jgi:hypothetical protein
MTQMPHSCSQSAPPTNGTLNQDQWESESTHLNQPNDHAWATETSSFVTVNSPRTFESHSLSVSPPQHPYSSYQQTFFDITPTSIPTSPSTISLNGQNYSTTADIRGYQEPLPPYSSLATESSLPEARVPSQLPVDSRNTNNSQIRQSVFRTDPVDSDHDNQQKPLPATAPPTIHWIFQHKRIFVLGACGIILLGVIAGITSAVVEKHISSNDHHPSAEDNAVSTTVETTLYITSTFFPRPPIPPGP